MRISYSCVNWIGFNTFFLLELWLPQVQVVVVSPIKKLCADNKFITIHTLDPFCTARGDVFADAAVKRWKADFFSCLIVQHMNGGLPVVVSAPCDKQD